MYLQPSYLASDIFYSFSQNKMKIVDGQLKSLKEFDIDFNISDHMTDQKHLNGQPSTSYAQLYAPVRAGSRTFLQYFDWIYEVKLNNVVKVCQIPDLPEAHWMSYCLKMCSIKDELYFTNFWQIFKLVDNKPVLIKNQRCDAFIQFGDIVLTCIFDQEQTIVTQISDDLKDTSTKYNLLNRQQLIFA